MSDRFFLIGSIASVLYGGFVWLMILYSEKHNVSDDKVIAVTTTVGVVIVTTAFAFMKIISL